MLKKVPVLDRLEMTIKHQLYFDVLLFKEDINPQFVIKYYNDCKNKNQTIDWPFLWEIARSYNIDWLLISRKKWRNVAKSSQKEERELIKELFKYSSNANELEYLIENYWDLKIEQKKRGNKTFLEKLLNDKDFNITSWPNNLEDVEDNAKILELKKTNEL